MNNNITWKVTNEPVPRSAAQIFCIDQLGRVFIIHRSMNVRSVKNAWSFPSGLHDIGEDLYECAARELQEEFGLTAMDTNLVDAYDNIAGDPEAAEQWHWLVHVLVCKVHHEDMVNNEPDKHDEVRWIPLSEFPAAVSELNFHSSFKTWFASYGHKLIHAFQCLIA